MPFKQFSPHDPLTTRKKTYSPLMIWNPALKAEIGEYRKMLPDRNQPEEFLEIMVDDYAPIFNMSVQLPKHNNNNINFWYQTAWINGLRKVCGVMQLSLFPPLQFQICRFFGVKYRKLPYIMYLRQRVAFYTGLDGFNSTTWGPSSSNSTTSEFWRNKNDISGKSQNTAFRTSYPVKIKHCAIHSFHWFIFPYFSLPLSRVATRKWMTRDPLFWLATHTQYFFLIFRRKYKIFVYWNLVEIKILGIKCQKSRATRDWTVFNAKISYFHEIHKRWCRFSTNQKCTRNPRSIKIHNFSFWLAPLTSDPHPLTRDPAVLDIIRAGRHPRPLSLSSL